MTHRLLGIAMLAFVASAGSAAAHEHKVMGTVTMAAPDHLMMKSTDGKEVTVTVNKATRVTRGKTPVRVDAIKAGTRVVVTTASDEPPYAAILIQVGSAPAGTSEGAALPAAAPIETWLKEYDAAFNARDLDKLAAFYHPDVTVYEGGGVNNGWIDYRDKHLGPELKEFHNLQFGHSNTHVTLLGDGRAAYVTATYSLKARMGERDVDSGGLETLVLVKDNGGSWKIRHSHTSARGRRPAAP